MRCTAGFQSFDSTPCLLVVFEDGVADACELCVAAVLASGALAVCGGEEHGEGCEVFVCGVGGEVVEECSGL